jgi:hypothetical protein
MNADRFKYKEIPDNIVPGSFYGISSQQRLTYF